MKDLISWKLILIIIVLSLLFIRCGEDDNPTEPDYNSALVGNWNVDKISWVGQSESGSYERDQLDSLGTVWILVLKSDKTVEQTSNYCCALSTRIGTWCCSDFTLSLELKIPNSDQSEALEYKFVLQEGKLVLDWRSSSGTIYYAEFIKQ